MFALQFSELCPKGHIPTATMDAAITRRVQWPSQQLHRAYQINTITWEKMQPVKMGEGGRVREPLHRLEVLQNSRL